MADPAQWDFMLVDASGNNLAELVTASGRSISFKRNSYSEVQFSLSHNDDAAAYLLSALSNTGVPKLKAYRRGPNDPLSQAAPLRFRGYLAAISEQADENSTLTATFRSPFGVLVGDGDKTGRLVQDVFGRYYSAVDAGAIAKDLIDNANADSPTGLATDPTRIQATQLRDRSYSVGQNIGAAVQDLSAALDGYDFFETFVDSVGPTDAYFNVVQSIGAVNSGARFEYGETTLGNVWQVQRTTLPPQNCILVTGGNGLTSVYMDASSVAKYGKWWGRADFSTIIDQPTLDDKARGLCRPNPVKTLQIVPDLALSPLPFDDWNLGDTVTFYANRDALQENVQIQINSFTIPITDDGLESIQVQDWSSSAATSLSTGATSLEQNAVAKASLVAEVLAE